MEYEVLFGIGIMFGLSFIFTLLTGKDIETFFVWLCIFSAFTVWGGFLPLWVLIATFIVVTVTIITKMRDRDD